MSKKEKSQSYVKSIKAKFKQITHDNVWDSDEDIKESAKISKNKQENIDTWLKDTVDSRPKIQRQLSYTPEVDETSDYESEYHALTRPSDPDQNRSLASSRFSHSVPDLHWKENRKGKEDPYIPKALSKTSIYIKNSKEVIVAPNDSVANIVKTNVIPENQEILRQVKVRTSTMLKMFDSTKPKIETELFNAGLNYIHRETHFPLVIFKGSRSRCRFAAKMLFKKLVKSEVNNLCLQTAKELSILDENENLVLVIDANGSTGENRERLDDWYEILKERMPLGSKELGSLTLILTINDCSGIRHPIFETYSDYVLNANAIRPSNETRKKLIHALLQQNNIKEIPDKNGPVPTKTERGKIQFISKETLSRIENVLPSKECIGELSDFFKGHLSEGLDFFRKPVPCVVQEIRKLYEKGNKLFLGLLAVHFLIASKGPIQHNVNEDFEKFEKQWHSLTSIDKLSQQICDDLGKEYGLDMQFLYSFSKKNEHQCDFGQTLRKVAKGMVGKYLEIEGKYFKFSNERIYYSFLLVLSQAYPKALQTCDEDFFFHFVKLHDSAATEEQDTCMIIDDKKLDKVARSLCCRFKTEIMLQNVAKCMAHPVMSSNFFKIFLKYLRETSHLTWKVLKQIDSDPEKAYCSLYHGMMLPDGKKDYLPQENITEIILRTKIWKKKRGKSKWKDLTALQEKETLVRASELSNVTTFRLLLDIGAEISLRAVQKAIDNGSEEILRMIIKSGHSATAEGAKYAAFKLCDKGLTPEFVKLLKQVVAKYSTDQPPLIHWIVTTNNSQLLTKLLNGELVQTEVDVNTIFNGITPVHAAVRSGFQNIVGILLNHKARLCHRDFVVASSKGDVPVLKLLYEWRPATVYEEDMYGLTPLFHAVSKGNLDAVKFILSTSNSRSHLCHVSLPSKHDVNEIQETVDKNDSLRLEPDLQTKNLMGQTALHVAAKKGHVQIIDVLVKEGFDITMKDKSGNSPLALACRKKHFQAIQYILRILKSNDFPVDEDVIIQIVRNEDTDILELVSKCWSPIICTNSTYHMVMRESVGKSLYRIVQCILSNGGDPNKDIDGQRLIHFAAMKNDFDMLKTLIEYGADISAKTDKSGDSIIHIGVQSKYEDFVVRVFKLPESDDLIDMINDHGDTALHVACKIGHPILLEHLLELGFLTNIKNKDNLHPLAIVDHELQSAKFHSNTCKYKAADECRQILENHIY